MHVRSGPFVGIHFLCSPLMVLCLARGFGLGMGQAVPPSRRRDADGAEADGAAAVRPGGRLRRLYRRPTVHRAQSLS